MMSGHGANPILFNNKKTDWTPKTLTKHPHPTSDNISFLPDLSPPHPLKVDVICVSPLIW